MHHNFLPNSDNNPEDITPEITPEEFSEKEFLVPYILKRCSAVLGVSPMSDCIKTGNSPANKPYHAYP
ncbi:MAG: hypothetical protein F6K55_41890 [Moorea sp. SIO4A3]|nr:hypothetical protein [Moorena sp. SIO4A3]